MFFLPLLLAAGVYGVYRWHEGSKKPALWTPERQTVYSKAIRQERDPHKLTHWADWFDAQGLHPHAKALRNRCRVPEVHGEGRTTRAALARKALKSQNHEAVAELAVGYEAQGYGATAECLRGYARGLELSRSIAPVFGLGTVIPSYAPPPPPPQPLDPPIPTTDPNNQYLVGQPGMDATMCQRCARSMHKTVQGADGLMHNHACPILSLPPQPGQPGFGVMPGEWNSPAGFGIGTVIPSQYASPPPPPPPVPSDDGPIPTTDPNDPRNYNR